MAQNSYPFETQDTTEAQYSTLFNELQDTGVAGDTFDNQGVRATVGAGMTLTVSTGIAIIRGFVYENTDNLTLTADPAVATPRIDTVVLRLDPASNSIVAAIKKGTPNASPSAPALTQQAGAVWEMPLADILVPASATALDPANLTDRRSFLGSRVGLWQTSTRPVNPDHATMGYNLTTSKYEWFNSATNAWSSLLPIDIAPIADGSITTALLADGSVTSAKLVDGSVTVAKLADGSVSTAKLADSSVATAKIADNAVTDAKLVNKNGIYSMIRAEPASGFTVSGVDVGRFIRYTSSNPTTVNLDGSGFPTGGRIDFIQDGTGQITFAGINGSTIASVDNKLKTNKRYSVATAVHLGSGLFRLIGDLTA